MFQFNLQKSWEMERERDSFQKLRKNWKGFWEIRRNWEILCRIEDDEGQECNKSLNDFSIVSLNLQFIDYKMKNLIKRTQTHT